MYITVLLFYVTKKLAQPNPSNQALLKALFSGKLVDSPWSLTQTPWRWTTPDYWQKPSSIQVKLTRKTNCPFIHCWGFWCWILNAVRCIMRMLFYSIDWVIKFRSWKKEDWRVYWSDEWSGKVQFLFRKPASFIPLMYCLVKL